MSTLRGRAFPGPLIATFVSGLWSAHTPLASRGERTLGPDRGRRLLMPAKLFVGNLSFQATEEDLRELFAQAGFVARIGEIVDRRRCVEFQELNSRSLINRLSGPAMPFGWTVNPFRGCEFGCRYCYARPTHEYLGHCDPEEFEDRIYVKRTDAA